ncbi:MAG TPA: NAD(P)H-dependent oxidoreductase [Polyangia bacterium]|nr:NAD(P)H-dependent oxidoreductase [Polyangia bacterium]
MLVCGLLLAAVRELPGVHVRSLYNLYPDFDINIEAEREALAASELIVWQSPFYWYGLPALLHLWIEKVLAHGWAYGAGGTHVRGKSVLWVTTTGAAVEAYAPGQVHGHRFETFVPAVAQTAAFCGMRWIDPPLVLHGAHRVSDAELRDAAAAYRRRLELLIEIGVPATADRERLHA